MCSLAQVFYDLLCSSSSSSSSDNISSLSGSAAGYGQTSDKWIEVIVKEVSLQAGSLPLYIARESTNVLAAITPICYTYHVPTAAVAASGSAITCNAPATMHEGGGAAMAVNKALLLKP
jgi:hypothetical protein